MVGFMVHGSVHGFVHGGGGPYDFSVSPNPLGTDLTGFDWVGAGLRGFGVWDGA